MRELTPRGAGRPSALEMPAGRGREPAARLRQEKEMLSASVTIEQQDEEVEEDSASSAELYALLSSLAGLPLPQAIAAPGSDGQCGAMRAADELHARAFARWVGAA